MKKIVLAAAAAIMATSAFAGGIKSEYVYDGGNTYNERFQIVDGERVVLSRSFVSSDLR